MNLATSFHHHRSEAHQLCPNCGNSTIRITTTMLVHYDVVYESTADDFAVIDELLGDAMWDGNTGATCHACGWHGTVSDVRERQRSFDRRS